MFMDIVQVFGSFSSVKLLKIIIKPIIQYKLKNLSLINYQPDMLKYDGVNLDSFRSVDLRTVQILSINTIGTPIPLWSEIM